MDYLDFDDLGNKVKKYEAAGTSATLMPGLPTLARMDGRAFHTFARNLAKPFDSRMSLSMVETTKYLVDTFNADLGYTQSDEITLYWRNLEVEKELYFGGRIHKWISSLAASCSISFYKNTCIYLGDKANETPTFDSRVWQVPNEHVALESILWREMDANKNAISMAASSVFSEKELNGKNSKERIQMLHEKGIDFDKYPSFFKRGTFVRKRKLLTELTEKELEQIPVQYRPENKIVTRSKIVEINVPKLTSYDNIDQIGLKLFEET
jgi:tRNA(His) 5'-end guanylyltransferase